jgi:hypothetical protein
MPPQGAGLPCLESTQREQQKNQHGQAAERSHAPYQDGLTIIMKGRPAGSQRLLDRAVQRAARHQYDEQRDQRKQDEAQRGHVQGTGLDRDLTRSTWTAAWNLVFATSRVLHGERKLAAEQAGDIIYVLVVLLNPLLHQ